jgi:hypothetical protein
MPEKRGGHTPLFSFQLTGEALYAFRGLMQNVYRVILGLKSSASSGRIIFGVMNEQFGA